MQRLLYNKTLKKLIQIYSRLSFVVANEGSAAMKQQFPHFNCTATEQSASQEYAYCHYKSCKDHK